MSRHTNYASLEETLLVAVQTVDPALLLRRRAANLKPQFVSVQLLPRLVQTPQTRVLHPVPHRVSLSLSLRRRLASRSKSAA